MPETTREQARSSAPVAETATRERGRGEEPDAARAQKTFGNRLLGEVLGGGAPDDADGVGTALFEPRRASQRGALLRSLLLRADGGASTRPAFVQREASASRIHEAAVTGLSGTPRPLPHLDRIERAFGAHGARLRSVRTYIGGPAYAANRAMGSVAYARGEAIAFRAAPNLHTAAHEAAHVVQQRGGVALADGVGAAGDVYERNADAVADAVVAGLSAEALLGETAPKDVGRYTSVRTEAVQHKRGATPGEPSSEGASATATRTTLRSSHGDIAGRSVSDVGADLLLRAARHRAAVPKIRKLNLQQQRGEESWYEESGGLIGRTIELFNRERRPDPARWAEVLRRWDEVASLLDAALETEVTPASINAVGESVMKALTAFNAGLELSARCSSEFDTYLRGYSHSAEGFVKVTTVARDISFAAAVSLAVVVAAPVIFASASTAAATIGLTGKAATLFAGGATVVGSGALGAAIEGGGQATSALLVESTELLAALTDKNTTWQQAIDRFSWREIGGQGWEGMKRGFVDGVLAYAALGFDKVLQAGVKVGLDRVLGNAGSTLLAQICRRALTRAISGGATGAVIGALDAGVKAAVAKRSLGEIVGAMKLGFFLGAAIGIVLGGAGGALEARAIQRQNAEILQRLEKLLASEPDGFRSQYEQLLARMTQEQRVAFEREIAGRRFVDAEHYQPARREYEAGRSQTPPEHAYGEREFKDWSEAARELDAKAARGEPLTQSDVEAAHGTAARTLTEQPGVIRTSPGPLYASGGVGAHGLWTKLTPAEIAVLKSNPHILLDARGTLALKPKEVAAGLQTAVITYPEGGTVLARLQTFFAWFRQNQHAGDAIAFAARAQREFISIHPFIDGNGRVSRLVMDYALRSRGLPPSLLSNPNVDYLVSEAAWAAEIRKGVITTFETAQRHVGAFNSALRSGDLRLVALRWSAVLGLTSDPPSLIAWLYGETSSSS